jgi:hypothetical protein
MQHYVRVHRALFDGRIEGAVVALAMMLDRDLVIIMVQGIKIGGSGPFPIHGSSEQIFGADKQVFGRRQSD